MMILFLYLFYLLCIPCHSQNVTVQQKWVIPHPELRFDQVAYLCSHNSFANKDEGFKNAQQKKSLKKQIEEDGVRSFMLDVYWFQGDVYLCHEECGGKGIYKRTGSAPAKVDSAESFFKAVGKIDDLLKDSVKQLKAKYGDDLGYKKFNHALNVICDFLDQNPQEVFTIFLQNETSSEKVYKVIAKNKRASKYWLKADDWDPYAVHEGIPLGGWPTLKELQEKNKRLIIFDSKPSGEEYNMFYQWFYTFENWYNTDDISKLCGQRTESNIEKAKKAAEKLLDKYQEIVKAMKQKLKEKPQNTPTDLSPLTIVEGRLQRFKHIKKHITKRQLVVINNFKPGKDGSKSNTYSVLTKLFKDCQGKLPKNYPNFIALNHVEKGNPIEFVNMINKQNVKNIGS